MGFVNWDFFFFLGILCVWSAMVDTIMIIMIIVMAIIMIIMIIIMLIMLIIITIFKLKKKHLPMIMSFKLP